MGSTDWLIISLSRTRIHALLARVSLSIATALKKWNTCIIIIIFEVMIGTFQSIRFMLSCHLGIYYYSVRYGCNMQIMSCLISDHVCKNVSDFSLSIVF